MVGMNEGEIKMKTIAVWFSCGAASAVAAKKTIEVYGKTHLIRVLNNPVVEEDPDNRRFLKDVERWLDVKIESVTNPAYPDCSAVDVWEDRKYMSGIKVAPCTFFLKKDARRRWELKNNPDFHVLGFTADEKKRFGRFLQERPNTLPVLIDLGITKDDCFDIIQDAGILLPLSYRLGFPNANCIGCVKATSATYWNHVRKHYPDVFAERAEQSRRLGAKLVRHNGVRIFLDELPEDAQGRKLKKLNIECSIFCK